MHIVVERKGQGGKLFSILAKNQLCLYFSHWNTIKGFQHFEKFWLLRKDDIRNRLKFFGTISFYLHENTVFFVQYEIWKPSFKVTTPWRIGTLKYLEVKIEEWPSRAKWGQAGPNRAKWCQMVPNRVKRGHTGSNGAKKGQKGPTEPKVAKRAKRGQTRPNGVIWGWFFACTHIFMRLKNHV